MKRGSGRILVVLWFAFLSSVAAPLSGEPFRGDPLRIIALGVDEPARRAGSGFEGFVDSEAFEVSLVAAVDLAAVLAPDTLPAADVLLLGPRVEPAALQRVLPVIRESTRQGLGLLVVGSAAWELPDDTDYGELVGRATRPQKEPKEPVAGGVRVIEQRHPVTQCITDFFHDASVARVLLNPKAERLAERAPVEDVSAPGTENGGTGDGGTAMVSSRPLIWSQIFGRGRVFVSALDPRSGRSRGLAESILARGAEWAARRRVATPLAGPMQLAAQAWGEASLAPPEPHVAARWSARDGFFMGRQIAAVMSYRGADWLVRKERAETERPDDVLEALALVPGSTVVDLGAGNGYFTLRMAKLVSPNGKVLAVDIQKEMLTLLEQRSEAANITNIEYVLATPDNPGLEENTVDLVLLVDVYHEFENPHAVLSLVRRALRPGGRVALVEYRGEDPSVPIKPLHRMTLPQVKAELDGLGYRVLQVHEFLPHQRIIVAGVQESPGKPTTAPSAR